mmetsp:Transcript_2083/g.6172  ORF Transcript_2083/g.6172 Transcript_2083/m.6172 type:complete len:159 (+) Transcript_2083:37-513(+)
MSVPNGSAELMEDMSIFAAQRQVQELLQEYLRRVILQRPSDVVAFLIDEIKQRPYVPTKGEAPESQDEDACDLRSVETKRRTLKQLFDRYSSDDRLDRAKLLVALAEDPSVLLSLFPRHAQDLPAALEAIDLPRDGLMTWPQFSHAALACLAKPGSSS